MPEIRTTEHLHLDVSSSATEDPFPGSVGNKVVHPCQQLKLSFVAGGEAAKEATWIRAFLKEIGKRNLEAIPLFCDNQGAIRVANNPELHRRMKHVELRFRFVQQAQKTGVIDACFVDSRNQVADIFTKALPTPSYQYLRQKLGVMDCRKNKE